jgi:hypothetical protein
VVRRNDEEMSAHREEKLEAQLGKRNFRAPGTRCALRDLELSARCLSWVRREPHAQFFGEGVVAILPPYPPTYAPPAPPQDAAARGHCESSVSQNGGPGTLGAPAPTSTVGGARPRAPHPGAIA